MKTSSRSRVFPLLAVVPSVLFTACNSTEIEQGVLGPPDTDSAGPPAADGADETGGDSDGQPQRVCAVYEGDEAIVQGPTYRWHCSGASRGRLRVQLPPIPGLSQDVLDEIANTGLFFRDEFGPASGATWDDPAVIACCEADYDYSNTPPPTDDDAEHGWACGVDCIDQTCRMIPDLLTKLANEHKALLQVAPATCWGGASPCYYDQLLALDRYVGKRQEECAQAFFGEMPVIHGHETIVLGGELDLDQWIAENDPGADAMWPDLQGIIINGSCGINDTGNDGWLQPPGPDLPCTNSNDNNDDDPIGAGYGGGLWGPDSFVVSSGQISLDGPTYMGIEADGVAPMKGLSNTDCEAETCSRLAVNVGHEVVHLQELLIVAPESLAYGAEGNTLLLDDFRVQIDHPRSAMLDALTSTFTFESGTVEAIASGKVYGAPVFAELQNTGPIQGQILELQPGTYGVSLEPMTFGFTDHFGNEWTLHANFGTMIPLQRAPVARFEMKHVDDLLFLDASTSVDGDGDELGFTWYVDGAEAGHGSRIRVPWDPQAIHVVTLRVVDAAGRDDWTLRLFDDDL